MKNDKDLQNENEEIRKNLIEKGGCVSGLSNLSPQLENQFLNNIEEFDNAFDNCKQIAVYDFIGRPEFIKANDVADEEIENVLNGIMQILNSNNIGIDTICNVDDRELYRFITEELFVHQMDDVRIKGMQHCYIYEEFHPNHRYDLERYCSEFVTELLNKEDKYFDHQIIDEEGFKTRLINFRDSFLDFKITKFQVNTIEFDTEKASVSFFVDFSSETESGGVKQRFSGEGYTEFISRYGYWYVVSVKLPELLKM